MNPAIIGRNRPCPCGSGKKRKYCHPDLEVREGETAPPAPSTTWKYTLLAAVALGGLGFASYQMAKPAPPLVVPPADPKAQALGSATPALPPGMGALTPPPPGPVPPGKVWSYEHGHWHDATTNAAVPTITTSTGEAGTLTQIPSPVGGAAQPPGEAPPGKVWSPEHGHWHDIPASGAGTPMSTGAAPTPVAPEAPTLTPISEPTPILDLPPGTPIPGATPQDTPPNPR